MKPSLPRLLVRLMQLAAFAAVLVIAALAFWPGALPSLRSSFAAASVRQHRDVIEFAANESGVDPNLLAGMVRAESSGQVGAVSHKGALGLFQLMLPTAVERAAVLDLDPPTREDLVSDPLLNARLGANYVAYLIQRSDGNLERALVAYNTGPTRVARWISEAGSYAAWSEERRAAGNSDVLAFADRVLRYRDEYAASGFFEHDDEAEEVEE
jgi:soluble lytic murein transglycosylase